METIFIKLFNMSIAASWLILVVILLRLLLRKAPKSLCCILWALVGIRLICPFSFESVLSLIPSAETVSPNILYSETPTISSGIDIVNSTVNPVITESLAPQVEASVNPLQIVVYVMSIVWLGGIAAMLLYSVLSYVYLCRKVATAVLLRDNIWQSEKVSSPFVLGLFRPRIYIPFSTDADGMQYVIAHEAAHIQRHDHWIKPLGFLILTVYWFNPLVWLAYTLLCRDIELACDERVIKELGVHAKKAYSSALLEYSVGRNMIAACPLAFGEVGVKQRVKNVLNYKKPAFWIIIVALASIVIVAICFLTNPKTDNNIRPLQSGAYTFADGLYTHGPISEYNPEHDTEEMYFVTKDYFITADEGTLGQYSYDNRVQIKEPDEGIYLRFRLTSDYGNWGYYMPSDQGTWQDTFEKVMSRAKKGSWRDDETSYGIWLSYMGETWQFTEDGSLVSFNLGRIDGADTPEIQALVTPIAQKYGVTMFKPSDISDLTSATMMFNGKNQTITDSTALSALEKLLTDVTEYRGGTACPFGAFLTLTMQNDAITLAVATDSCCVYMVNGVCFSYVGNDNSELFQLFGMESPDSFHYEYEYDAGGNVIKKTLFYADGSAGEWYEYEYKEGNCVAETYHSGDGSLLRRMEYEYDAAGNQIKETVFTNNAKEYWIEFKYNTAGMLMERTKYDIDYTALNKTEYQYNSNGYCVKEINYDSYYNPDGSVSSWYEYKYDNHGNQIKMTVFDSDGTIYNWWEYEYDKNGNRVKETYFNSDGVIES